MGTPFVEIFNMFLHSINTDEILSQWEIDPDAVEEVLKDLLFRSADLTFSQCRFDLTQRDDESFEDELHEMEKRILALAMRVNYTSSYLIADEQAISSRFFTKDYKVFSPANKLNVLNEALYKDRHMLNSLIRRYEMDVVMGVIK